MRYSTRWLWDEFSSEPGGDLAIFDHDEGFPYYRSPFRRVEYSSYLHRYPGAAVFAYSLGRDGNPRQPDLPTGGIPAPELRDRFLPISSHPIRPGRHALAYCVFLSNAARFVGRFESAATPFCFTLYPGGGFLLNDAQSDDDLRRVCSSPCFRGVVATQSVTRRYLVDGGFCRPDQITFSFGGVFPLGELTSRLPPRRRYRDGKPTFDVGFVAFKYSPRGTEKGYDLFLDTARRLAAVVPDARFHVVGNFGPADVPVDDIVDRLTFYGPRSTDFFPGFYSSLDVILAPNIPSPQFPGLFDGFPTGCCIEAGSCGVVVMCTDPLGLNGPFRTGEDILVVPRDVAVICESLIELAGNPDRLRSLSENGMRTFHRVFGEDVQLNPRHELIDRLLGPSAVRRAA
jgi:glycosyltransferase involved in cell wall biosynthesis